MDNEEEVVPPHESEFEGPGNPTEEEAKKNQDDYAKVTPFFFLGALFVPPAAPFLILCGIVSAVGSTAYMAEHENAKQYNEMRQSIIDQNNNDSSRKEVNDHGFLEET